MDLTPEDIKILYLAAEAFLAAGDPITIGDIEANLPIVLGLIAADPRWRAGVLAAYRAGREDAAREVMAAADDPDHGADDEALAAAYGKAKEIAQAGQHPSTPGEDVTP